MSTENYIVKILSIQPITHNVRRYRVEKPEGYTFEPGQATEISINQGKWKNERRPFTFTCLEQEPYLEFTIKSYFDHEGMTNELYKLEPGDELILHDVWGTITYKGEGYFIAGGAGITPFIAILRRLYADGKIGENQLYFSNKKEEDIILHAELNEMLGRNAHYVITGQQNTEFERARIDRAYIAQHIKNFTKPFYICGPDPMVADLKRILGELGAKADSVVFEK